MTPLPARRSGGAAPERFGLHPGAWLVWAVGAGLVAISTTNPFYLLPLAASAWIVHVICGRHDDRAWRVFLTIAAIAVVMRTVLVAFGPIGSGSVVGAALEGLRLGVLLVIFGTFNSVADPSRVLKLAPRRFYEVSLAAALALSIAPRTLAAIGRVREAQRMRGFGSPRWRSLPVLVVPVLQNGLEDAIVLAESMDARGHGRGRRSRYRPEGPSAAAICVAASAAAAAALFIGTGLSGGGDLLPSMTPPEWPDASFALTAAAFSFASPAAIAVRS